MSLVFLRRALAERHRTLYECQGKASEIATMYSLGSSSQPTT